MKQIRPRPNFGHSPRNTNLAQSTSLSSPHTYNWPTTSKKNQYCLASGPDETDSTWLDRNSKLIPTITGGQDLWTKVDILYNQKVVGCSMVHTELQVSHPTRHWRPDKKITISPINTIVTYHYNQGMQWLPKICHFLFKIYIHTLLSLLIWQSLLYIYFTSSAHNFPQIISNRIN